MGCVEHGKDHHSGWAGRRGSGEEACRGCRVHKSCHRSECQGGARSLLWQQTRASKPTNLIPRKIGTSSKTLYGPLLPQPCACPPLCWEWRTKATTPSTGFVPPSPENLALTIQSWLPHRLVPIQHCVRLMHFSSQDSGFSCDGLVFGGYYADPATECQQYSVCLQVVDSCNLNFST